VPDVALAGCVDLDPAALRLAAEGAGVPERLCFTSLPAALAETRPDAVLVATTLPGHVPVTTAALDAGCHVIVEKPFAPTLDEARALVERADALGLALMVSQNYRWFPAPRAVARLVRSGELGRLHDVQVEFRHRSTSRPGQPGHRLLAQPLLLDMAIHHLDLMRWLLGREPASVSCAAWNPPWSGFAGPPVGVAAVRFGADVVAGYHGSWLSHGPDTPWAGEWRMDFEAGEAWWTSRWSMLDAGGDRLVLRRGGGEAADVALAPLPLLDRAACLAELVAAVGEGREPESSGRDNLGTLAMALAAVESAERGAPVAV
jgi:predicted dehydrogenase